MVDQEGGDIRTVEHVGPARGAAVPGRSGRRAPDRPLDRARRSRTRA